MKKNMSVKKIMMVAAVSTMVMSMTAIADEAPIPATPIEITSAEVDPAEITTQYQLVKGTVSSIEEMDGYTRIEITNDNMGMVFTVENGMVIDQATSEYKSVSDIAVGMEITAVLDNESPMTMSIPPMTSGAKLFVINQEAASMDLSVYGEDLVNKENTLALNIGEDTMIGDIRGSRKMFAEQDLANQELLVMYTISTKSIPAQTTPSMVIILSVEEDATQEGETPAVIDEPVAVEVGLRASFEALGYEVKWTANDAPVMIQKDDMVIEVVMGSKEVKINGEAKEISKAPALVDGTMMVGADLMDMLK